MPKGGLSLSTCRANDKIQIKIPSNMHSGICQRNLSEEFVSGICQWNLSVGLVSGTCQWKECNEQSGVLVVQIKHIADI